MMKLTWSHSINPPLKSWVKAYKYEITPMIRLLYMEKKKGICRYNWGFYLIELVLIKRNLPWWVWPSQVRHLKENLKVKDKKQQMFLCWPWKYQIAVLCTWSYYCKSSMPHLKTFRNPKPHYRFTESDSLRAELSNLYYNQLSRGVL